MAIFKTLSLRSRVILAFLGIGLLPLLALAYSNLYVSTNTLRTEAKENLFNVASQSAEHIDYWITTQRTTVKNEATLPDFVAFLEANAAGNQDAQLATDAQNLLDSLADRDSTFTTSYGLLDLDGTILLDTNQRFIGQSEAMAPYFTIFQQPVDETHDHDHAHSQTEHLESYISPPLLAPDTGNPSIYVSAPVKNEAGHIIGILRVRFNAATLQAQVKELSNLAGKGSFGVLFDEYHIYLGHGQTTRVLYRLAHSVQPGVLQQLQTENRLVKPVQHNFYTEEEQEISQRIALDLKEGITHEQLSLAIDDGNHTYDEHRENAVSFRAKDISSEDAFHQVMLVNLHEMPWILAIYLPEVEFLSPIQTQTRNILVASGILGLLLILSALAFANVLTQPIVRLTQTAKQIEAGNLQASVETNAPGEIGQLGTAFNGMTSKLRYYIEQLEEEKKKDHETAKRKQERMLSLLAATFDSTADGILVTDKSGATIQANNKIIDVWQIPQGVVRRPIDLNLTHLATLLQDHRQLGAVTQQLTEDPDATITETLMLRNTKVLELFTQPQTNTKQETIGRVWSFRDVTVRHQHAEALIDQQKLLAQQVAEQTAEIRAANVELARTSQAKDEFLASMSHELRTPLSAILGNTEMLSEGIMGEVSERQNNSLKIIHNSGSHLLSLINDILDIAKVGAGNLKLDIRETFVREIVHASMEFIRVGAERKNLSVYVDIDPNVRVIDVDTKRFKQILVNLLNNAVKFTPDNGKVGIKIVGDAKHDVAKFMIWDTGIGIASEDLERLFKPFVQLDSKLSRRYEGTGLGLSLVYHMVELHGGNVQAQSKPDQGSLFTVTLPWTPRVPQTVAPEAISQPEALPIADLAKPSTAIFDKRHSLLIVDDNELNLTTFTEFLHAKGYRVHNARDGAEAVHLATSLSPDLILMDIQMPGMDGLEATRRIREINTLRKTPIIALTALAMPSDKELCLKAGASDYVSKPVSLKSLEKLVQVTLSTPIDTSQLH